MSATTTAALTLKSVLDKADPNLLADALRMVALGTMLTPKKFDSGVIAASATVVLPSPALAIVTCRTVASLTHAGPQVVTDSGGTPFIPAAANAAPGVATLSDDGTTLTFGETTTHVVVEYIPRPANDMNGIFGTTPGSLED